MADITLKPAPVLGGLSVEIAGCNLVERDDLAIVSLAVPLDGEPAVTTALKDAFGLDMPGPVQSSEANGIRAIKSTPDQLMLIFAYEGADAEPFVAEKIGGTGYTTDQTDVWVCLEFSGPAVRVALERLCPLDLHDSAFPVGTAARTSMEHMGAIIIRTGGERYLLLSASSSARSFLHAVETSLRYIDA